MSAYLIYMFKVAVLLALFYGGYRLFLVRETRHNMQRLVLLASVVMAFILPFLVITTTKEVWINLPLQTDFVQGTASAVVSRQSMQFSDIVPFVLMTAYLVGVWIVAVHVLSSNWKVWKIIKRSQQQKMVGCFVLCVSTNGMAPFNWWRYVVVGPKDINDKTILQHELGHVQHCHSLDLLLCDIVSLFQWWNPFVWLLRRELCTVHEFEADETVLAQGEDAHDYQMLLLRRVVNTGPVAVVNALNQSALRRRIVMMQSRPSSRWSYVRLLYLLSIIALSLSVTAETVTHYNYPNVTEEKAEKNLVLAAYPTKETKSIVAHAINTSKSDQEKVKKEEIVSALKDAATASYQERVTELGVNSEVVVTTNQGSNREATPKKSNEEKVFSIAEEMPEFPGGNAALKDYIAQNVRYPGKTTSQDIKGIVTVSFIVNEDGSLSNFAVTNFNVNTESGKEASQICQAMKLEALRVAGSMPRWKPARQMDHPVRCVMSIPVLFNLS